MKATLKFFKQDNKWYADVPNHTLEENEMVMGADIFLELVSKGSNEVYLDLTDEEPKQPLLTLHLRDHDEEGGWYMIYGFLYNDLVEKFPEYEVYTVWICNVTHDIFGEHPEYIWLTGINCGIV